MEFFVVCKLKCLVEFPVLCIWAKQLVCSIPSFTICVGDLIFSTADVHSYIFAGTAVEHEFFLLFIHRIQRNKEIVAGGSSKVIGDSRVPLG